MAAVAAPMAQQQKKKGDAPLPDGIAARHFEPRSQHGPSVFSLAVLAGIFAWGLSGFAGGRDTVATNSGPAATLDVRLPAFIRTGEQFEARIDVTAHRPIGRLVIAVTPGLWRDMALGAMTPQSAEQSFERDRYRFAYGKVAAGDRFAVKLDFQINPTLHGTNEGRVSVHDGDERLAEVAVKTHILP